MRGYFGIGVQNIKTAHNIGGLWRSAHALGASFIFTIGRRYRTQAADTTKAYRQIPLYDIDSFDNFQDWRPRDCLLIGVETGERDLVSFIHPQRAIYLLGAEDGGLSDKAKSHCSSIITIPSSVCLNVATAGSIVMYDRIAKQTKGERLNGNA